MNDDVTAAVTAALVGTWPRLADHSRDLTIPDFLRAETRQPPTQAEVERARRWLTASQPISQPDRGEARPRTDRPASQLPRNMDEMSWAILRELEGPNAGQAQKRAYARKVSAGLAEKRAAAWSGDLSINPADRITQMVEGVAVSPITPIAPPAATRSSNRARPRAKSEKK